MITDRKGFTLTELLVVVCVILILMSVLVVGAGGVYTYAMRLKCQHRMEQIWHACQMYANDYRGLLPASWDFAADRPWYQTLADENYLTDERVLACPSSDLAATIGSGEPGEAEPPADLPVDATVVQEAINEALRYLQARQDNGRWGGTWGFFHGLSGLATLAFLGNGVDIDHDEFGETLEEAIAWLMDQVYESRNWELYGGSGPVPGTFGQHLGGQAYPQDPATEKNYNYHQGICTMALCDATRMMPDLELTMPTSGDRVKLRDMAQMAFKHLIGTQLYAHGGFAYQAGRYWDGWNPSSYADSSISGWCWQAIMLAKDAELDPSPYTWDLLAEKQRRCLEFFCPTGGANYPLTPYWFCNNGSASSASWEAAPPLFAPGVRMAALSLGVRLAAGYELDGSVAYGTVERDGYEQYQTLTAGDNHIKNAQGTDGYTPDLYFLYYMTMAMNVVRGADWEAYIVVLCDELMDTLQQENGSFPSGLAPYGGNVGDIYTTALGAMTLEIAIADTLPDARWSGEGGGTSSPGQYSYGYNKLIADFEYGTRKPADDTVVLMDYLKSAIDSESDTPDDIAARHGGKVNVLFADGRIKAMTVDELVDPDTDTIKEGMLTLEPGD